MNTLVISIIVLTCIVSFLGFNNRQLFDRYKFNIYAILRLKQIDRLLTSGFLHADMMHLIFNMLTLYFFSDIVIQFLGNVQYLIIYLLAILGGNLLTLWVYRRDDLYSAIGASGGVSGIVFASIAIYPHLPIYIIPFPFPIPGWIYAIIYLGFSVYGMKRSIGNIGHAAHLGGCIVGLLSAVCFMPQILQTNLMYIGIMMIPILVMAYLVYEKK